VFAEPLWVWAVSGSAALGAMRRLIGRLIFQDAFDKGARMGTAPLVSPASAGASAPPLPRRAAPTRTPSGGTNAAPSV